MFKRMRKFFRVLVLGSILFLLTAGLTASRADAPAATLLWNTFMGPAGTGYPTAYMRDMAVDSAGNIYLVGSTSCPWGADGSCPGSDYLGFVAKLNNSGVRQWVTFLGSRNAEVPPGNMHLDHAFGISLDAQENIYVGGTSMYTWGKPIHPHQGNDDGFVARLDSQGEIRWLTFLGSVQLDEAWDIDTDAAGNIYLMGWGNTQWDTPPIHGIAGGYDPYVAKLSPQGERLWYTFLGGTDYDNGLGLAVDSDGSSYITGMSDASWGSPRHAYTECGIYVAKVDTNGYRLWTTFTGGPNSMWPEEIALDAARNIYLVGYGGLWPGELVSFAGLADGFLAKLSPIGDNIWHTHFGSTQFDEARDLAVDTAGNIYVAGTSTAAWGTPQAPYTGDWEAFAAKFTPAGTREWNTFMGSADGENAFGIAVDASLDVIVGGDGDTNWGTPVQPSVGYGQVFVTKWITQAPGVPVVISPGGLTTNTHPAYGWMPSSPADRYDLAVYSQGNPTPIIQGTDLPALAHCQGVTCAYAPGTLLPYGEYQVRVRAGNSFGWSAWSQPRSFTVVESLVPLYLPALRR